jgi:hypothetical protein
MHPRVVAAVLLSAWAALPLAEAVETADPSTTGTTRIVLQLDGPAVPIKTKFLDEPPTITVEFPGRRVTSSLPEQSAVSTGLIKSIEAVYERGASSRAMKALRVVLSAPYAHQVRSETGRVVIEIQHPASVHSASVQVGVQGGTILAGLARPHVTDRFKAMQDAMARATPTAWSMSLPLDTQPIETSLGASHAVPSGASTGTGLAIQPVGSRPVAVPPFAVGLVMAAGLLGVASTGIWLVARSATRSQAGAAPGRLPSGVQLLDQLVWRAFERQGYTLVIESELATPLRGTLRVVQKDQTKSALLFVGQAAFFEKRAIDQFVHVMNTVNVAQGFLVSSGSFTVPAQRAAKSHRVTLVGREQLTELLSAGAAGEYIVKKLEQQQAGLEETKLQLQQQAEEIEALRKQRNEASWYLGEERAAAAALQAQLESLTQQLSHHQTELERWSQDAVTLRRQWEESEWYLGESRQRVKFLEEQVERLRPAAERAEQAAQERDQAVWSLGEERSKREALETRFGELQQQLAEALNRGEALQAALSELTDELTALRVRGERRSQSRLRLADAMAELRNGSDEPVWTGSIRDLSRTGIGLMTVDELPRRTSFRLQISVPGHEPIESRARLVWQQPDGATRYASGCRFTRMSADAAASLDAVLSGAATES